MGNRRWPLLLIAAPAAVAVWTGWVGLGEMCGFGVVHPLPGIWDTLQLNTAITLPVGVEAYGAYALKAWLTPGTPDRARTFAKRSALGALIYGMLGQVVYHLLAAAHAVRAPWPVVVLVSCMPVVVLGFGAALTHLLYLDTDDVFDLEDEPELDDADEIVDEVFDLEDEPELDDADEIVDEVFDLEDEPELDDEPAPVSSNGHSADAHRIMDECGPDASLRTIQRTLKCGQAKAQRIQGEVREMRELAAEMH